MSAVAPLRFVVYVPLDAVLGVHKAVIYHQCQALIEPLRYLLGEPPPAQTGIKFVVAHFVGNHIGVEAVGVKHNKRLTPGRANATTRAFVAVAKILVLGGRLAHNDGGVAELLAPKTNNSLACLHNGRAGVLLRNPRNTFAKIEFGGNFIEHRIGLNPLTIKYLGIIPSRANAQSHCNTNDIFKPIVQL